VEWAEWTTDRRLLDNVYSFEWKLRRRRRLKGEVRLGNQYSTSSFSSPWTLTGWGWRPKNIEPADTCHLLDLIFFRQRTYWRIPLQKPLKELLSIFLGPKSLIPNPVICFDVPYIPHADFSNFSICRPSVGLSSLSLRADRRYRQSLSLAARGHRHRPRQWRPDATGLRQRRSPPAPFSSPRTLGGVPAASRSVRFPLLFFWLFGQPFPQLLFDAGEFFALRDDRSQ
jgi:hypothetical protein